MRQTGKLHEMLYQTARAYYQIVKAKVQKKEILFLFQMGKVGSSTLMTSFNQHGLDKERQIFWVTFLSNNGIEFLRQLHINGYGVKHELTPRAKRTLYQKQALARVIRQHQLLNCRFKVISLVRDPVAINVSGFFQNTRWWPPKLVAKCETKSDGYLTELMDLFLEKYPHHVPFAWFDSEMKPVFDIDVFADEFPVGDGFRSYHSSYAELLLIKLENLDQCGAQAVKDFLGLKEFSLTRANLARDKWYWEIYKEFSSSITISEEYLNAAYDSKLARHLYSDAEIGAFRSKWSHV